MTAPIVKLALFVRDLTSIPESNICIGRNGFRIDDFTGQQVVVDSVAPATLVSSSNTFDGDNESMAYTKRYTMSCTVNFYGDTAWTDASSFSVLVQSQEGYELQRDLGISVYQSGQLTDVKLLTGEQYSGRIEATLNIAFNVSVSVDTLRIDEAQLDDILTD